MDHRRAIHVSSNPKLRIALQGVVLKEEEEEKIFRFLCFSLNHNRHANLLFINGKGIALELSETREFKRRRRKRKNQKLRLLGFEQGHGRVTAISAPCICLNGG
jgi:hypothetical protein